MNGLVGKHPHTTVFLNGMVIKLKTNGLINEQLR
jgi:hypothetical protein